jgi:hypothetical protein
MSLSGQLSDLSLAELIEFFCNQHKTGRLKIAYNRGPGYFYFQNGALVDAKLGVLNGVDAVYYALTLENASFKFSTAFPPMNRSIHQPWAQVALEGLRRMDEGIQPLEAFPEGFVETDTEPDEVGDVEESGQLAQPKKRAAGDSMPLSFMVEGGAGAGRNKAFIIAGVAAVVVILIAAIGVPAGWYSSKKPAPPLVQTPASSGPEQNAQAAPNSGQPDKEQQTPSNKNPTIESQQAIQRERERLERERKQREAEAKKAAEANKPKTVMVTVTYDENGRVTSTSGGDAVAQRIARQRKFSPKPGGGTATVPVPVN